MTINFKDEIAKDMRESGFNVHKRYDTLTVTELKEVCEKEQNPFAVCALSVTGDLNVGSMIRTASLYGAQKFFIFGRRKYDRRGVVGANNYIDVEAIAGLKKDDSGELAGFDSQWFWANMFASPFTPVFIEQGGEILGQFDWKDKIIDPATFAPKIRPCLVFGNENRGIPDNILNDKTTYNQNSFRVSIPQRGVIRSHNVSVACGIVMHDMCMSMGW